MKSTDRMSLTNEEFAKLKQKIKSDPILSNAFRLFEDGDLLFSSERYASVVALAVLSLEEIGKFLLNSWVGTDPAFRYDKRKYHQSKQAAIAALFMSDSARKEVRGRMRSHTQKLNDLEPSKVAAIIWDAVQTGLQRQSEFANAVKGGAIDAVKFSGLYFDPDMTDKGIEPDKIDKAAARELMEQCSTAFMLIVDDANCEIARIVYDFIYPPKK